MECRYRVLLRCPECLRIFCVPELAGSSVVYHRECGKAMDRLESYPGDEHADRANVFYFKERDQLEVTNRAEGQ
ncbi:MAG: hypothetical protein MUQ56_08090 [Thermoleophilia bacterium]|nr:hypothetical protein [Thermoleophilia bacterium]